MCALKSPITAWSCSAVLLCLLLTSQFTMEKKYDKQPQQDLEQTTNTPEGNTIEVPNVLWVQVDLGRIDAMQMLDIASQIPVGTPYEFGVTPLDSSTAFLIFYPRGRQPIVIQATNARKTGVAVPAPVELVMSQ